MKVAHFDYGIKREDGKFVVYRNCNPFHIYLGRYATRAEAETRQAELKRQAKEWKAREAV